jgi:hypothetical protein
VYHPAKTVLWPPVISSKIRILPFSNHTRTVCMRVEVYGCPFKGNLQLYEFDFYQGYENNNKITSNKNPSAINLCQRRKSYSSSLHPTGP